MTKQYRVIQPFFNIHTEEWHVENQQVDMDGYTDKDIQRAVSTRLIEEIYPKTTVGTTKTKTVVISQAIDKEDSNGTSNST